MARKKDPNSVRQRAFKALDKMTDLKREVAIEKLKNTFSIGDSYAATLYAAHRTIGKETGKMTTVYTIRDVRDGQPVTPYLKVENTFNPPANACTSPKQAKQRYQKELKARIEFVKSL